jgi:hypothetical protein
VGAVKRPAYAYCLLVASNLAKRLGHSRMSAIEFGVAHGEGLSHLERHAAKIERFTGVRIEVYGFDTGAGLPPPHDYRDLPYRWKSGFYKMEDAVRARFQRAQLVIGDVRETCRTFFDKYSPAPIGCILSDLDYYSSTMDSFTIFDGGKEFFLPRAVLYFDDILGDAAFPTEVELCGDFTGERLAISEFNQASTTRKISPCRDHRLSNLPFASQVFVYHDFGHPDYSRFIL